MILRFAASGLDLKISNDMTWDLQRADEQQLLDSTRTKSFSMSDVVERKLNLADTEGMFLLMAIGYILAGSVLCSEIVGGCAKTCRAFIKRNSSVGDSSRRGSVISQNRFEQEDPKTFSEKLKKGIRRRLRSKPKPEEVEQHPNEIEAIENKKANESNESAAEPVLKGMMSFCTLKRITTRIMLMRKQRKEEKEKAKNELKDSKTDVTMESKEGTMTGHFGNYLDFNDEAIGSEQVTIENEKNCYVGDCVSTLGSSSIYSETHVIHAETEVEVNQLCVSDREQNPSKEFGEVV